HYHQTNPEPKGVKKKWKPKNDDVALIAHASHRDSSSEDWYFDSGCSKHMTGILGSGCLVNDELPKLDNVLLVRGLKVNLISISQLCDQGMDVNFNKGELLVTDNLGKVVMKGRRSIDNCYLWKPKENAQLSTCLIKEGETNLRHQKHEHLKLQDICRDQKGKQTYMFHSKLQHLVISRFLEPLQMDPMGPMQVEGIGRRRYASEFCVSEDIKLEVTSLIEAQQNGVVDSTIQESASFILHAKDSPYQFSAEAMCTACYTHNHVPLRKGTTCTLYELWKGRNITMKHLHVFVSKCCILADKGQKGKLDPNNDIGIFIGYFTTRAFNSRTKTMMVSVITVIDNSSILRISDVAKDVATPHRSNSPTNEDADINSDATKPASARQRRILQSEFKRITLLISPLDIQLEELPLGEQMKQL
ncbi:copia protein (gag-int-pol protein), partial [Trifolium medium]|nr:copia protein (gag-int-pol protein) [Trifolium medium]